MDFKQYLLQNAALSENTCSVYASRLKRDLIQIFADPLLTLENVQRLPTNEELQTHFRGPAPRYFEHFPQWWRLHTTAGQYSISMQALNASEENRGIGLTEYLAHLHTNTAPVSQYQIWATQWARGLAPYPNPSTILLWMTTIASATTKPFGFKRDGTMFHDPIRLEDLRDARWGQFMLAARLTPSNRQSTQCLFMHKEADIENPYGWHISQNALRELGMAHLKHHGTKALPGRLFGVADTDLVFCVASHPDVILSEDDLNYIWDADQIRLLLLTAHLTGVTYDMYLTEWRRQYEPA